MTDLPAALPSRSLEEAFIEVVDIEGKLIAALEDLGPIADRDVILLDAGNGVRARLMAEIGARVTSVTLTPEADEDEALDRMALLPQGQADAVVALWSQFAVPGSAFVAAAEKLLRPTGRLLLVHDYGRDDVWNLRPDQRARQVEWSQRRGPFAYWRHRHRFEPTARGTTLMTDEVEYALPLGWLGELIAGGAVRARLQRMFDYRHRVVAEKMQSRRAQEPAQRAKACCPGRVREPWGANDWPASPRSGRKHVARASLRALGSERWARRKPAQESVGEFVSTFSFSPNLGAYRLG